jgi:hypothetical protein
MEEPTAEPTVEGESEMEPSAETEDQSLADEYAVYSVVITEFYATEDVMRFVLLDETVDAIGEGGSAETIEPFLRQSFGASLTEGTLADFLHRRTTPVPLQVDAMPKLRYDLLNKAELDQLVDESGDWQPFFERFPEASGVIYFSPVGFDAAGEQALVYTAFYGDLGSGQGYYVLLAKRDGEWVVDQSVVAWVS